MDGLRKAAQAALEALELARDDVDDVLNSLLHHADRGRGDAAVERQRQQLAKHDEAIAALRAELAKPEPATAKDMAVYDAIANNYHNSVTDTMIDAYLIANDTYWRETDLIAPPPGKWRTGTVREATRVSLLAALTSRKPESYIEEDTV